MVEKRIKITNFDEYRIRNCRGCDYFDTTYGEKSGICVNRNKTKRFKCPIGKWEITKSMYVVKK